jgi:hypothetical protein
MQLRGPSFSGMYLFTDREKDQKCPKEIQGSVTTIDAKSWFWHLLGVTMSIDKQGASCDSIATESV